mmetsp:Transcript_23264/g.41597  ORF Transcript_23264/g.41597 Transcript_23264/m.41597 type:complete len:235 (-) Transcript_23264:4984-5688(-)
MLLCITPVRHNIAAVVGHAATYTVERGDLRHFLGHILHGDGFIAPMPQSGVFGGVLRGIRHWHVVQITLQPRWSRRRTAVLLRRGAFGILLRYRAFGDTVGRFLTGIPILCRWQRMQGRACRRRRSSSFRYGSHLSSWHAERVQSHSFFGQRSIDPSRGIVLLRPRGIFENILAQLATIIRRFGTGIESDGSQRGDILAMGEGIGHDLRHGKFFFRVVRTAIVIVVVIVVFDGG